ncbi:MAG: CHAT domain-containing protein, partial [Pseudomonadota bacterium]
MHIAAHAYFREDNPLFSFIELADGKLETLDILNLKFKAKLVVLSACESGHGVLKGGASSLIPKNKYRLPVGITTSLSVNSSHVLMSASVDNPEAVPPSV